MSEHQKKMIAPILITVLVIGYYIFYFALLIRLTGGVVSLLLGTVPLLLSGTMLYVCIQRIREIEGGEEDDLGQY